jgi:hypothetical protein
MAEGAGNDGKSQVDKLLAEVKEKLERLDREEAGSGKESGK